MLIFLMGSLVIFVYTECRTLIVAPTLSVIDRITGRHMACKQK
ncbi:hypothetical protein C7M37_00016 [Lactiplantibacillus plantarum]|nr:hypothetical protein C7M37_00016 [Lactiplantibacillus plantarum]